MATMQTTERKTCRACGNPLIQVIENRLYRCSVCGLYQRVRDQTSVLPLAFGGQELEKTELGQGGIPAEMKLFIERVAAKLMPGDSRQREKIQQGLEDCMLGKRTFNDWFNNTGVDCGIQSYNLLKILREALDGLTSPQANELRKEYQMAMTKISSL